MSGFGVLAQHPYTLERPTWLTAHSAWHEHIPFAFFLVSLLRPRLVVELGTHAGDSYLAFCQALAALAPGARAVAVDTWTGDAHTGSYGSHILAGLRQFHDPTYGTFSRLWQTTFDDARGAFADQSVDLLHIDGLHTYEAVRHDFDTWRSAVAKDGVILLHDTMVRDRGFGVWRLWEEIEDVEWKLEFQHGFGLGVLAWGEAASRLAEALPDAASARRTFAALGERIALLARSAWLQRQMESRAP